MKRGENLEAVNRLTEQIIGAAIEVHKTLGPGLLEAVYEESMCLELGMRNIPFEAQVPIPVGYKDKLLSLNYRVDVIVDNLVVLELKAVETLLPVHEAQLLTYLRLTGKRVGLPINFNVPVLKQGIRRRILG